MKSLIYTIVKLQKKLLATAHNQVEGHKAGIASRRTEMETPLIDSLTTEERRVLSSLNPEITKLKEQLIECKARRMDVCIFLNFCGESSYILSMLETTQSKSISWL